MYSLLWHNRNRTPIICCPNTLQWRHHMNLYWFWCCWNITKSIVLEYNEINRAGFGRAGRTFAIIIVHFWICICDYLMQNALYMARSQLHTHHVLFKIYTTILATTHGSALVLILLKYMMKWNRFRWLWTSRPYVCNIIIVHFWICICD